MTTPTKSEMITKALELYHNHAWKNGVRNGTNPTLEELKESGFISLAQSELMYSLRRQYEEWLDYESENTNTNTNTSLNATFTSSFKEKNMDDRILEFIRQVDGTYRGLGIPALYGTLSILANRSVLFIGARASGKSRTIKNIPNIKDTFTSRWDSLTLQGLAMRIGQIKDQHLVWKIDELGTFSKYHRRIFLDIIPKIISEGNYIHVTKSLHIEIVDCELTLLIAVQPILYSQLCRTENRWEAMATDRFTRFVMFNPLRSKTTDIDLNVKLNDTEKDVKLKDSINLEKVISLFKDQLSMRRAELFARDYAKAMACFCGHKQVKQTDVDQFYDLFWVYLEPFNRLQWAKDLEKPVEIQAGMLKLLSKIGCYNDGVTKKELAETFKVSTRNIEKYAVGLVERKLIEKESGGGREHETKYHICEPIEKFFKEYDKLV